MDLPSRAGSASGWTNRPGSSSETPDEFSKTLGVIWGDSRLGRAAMAFSSATPDRLHTTPDRPCAWAGEAGSSPDPDTRDVCVERKSVQQPCVYGALQSTEIATSDITSPQFAPVDTRGYMASVNVSTRGCSVGLPNMAEAVRVSDFQPLRQHSDWAMLSLPRKSSYTANVRAP